MLYGDSHLNDLSESIVRFGPIHTAVMLTYLRVAQLQLGLLLNFNTPYLRHGVRREGPPFFGSLGERVRGGLKHPCGEFPRA